MGEQRKKGSSRRASDRRGEHRRLEHRRKSNIDVDNERRKNVDQRKGYQEFVIAQASSDWFDSILLSTAVTE